MWRAIRQFLVAFLILNAVLLAGAQILPDITREPKPKQQPKPTAALKVTTDIECDWVLDGEPQGRLQAGEVNIVTLEPGEYLVRATSIDGQDSWQTSVTVAGQKTLLIPLAGVRRAREKEAAERKLVEERQKEEIRRAEEARKQEEARKLEEQRRQKEKEALAPSPSPGVTAGSGKVEPGRAKVIANCFPGDPTAGLGDRKMHYEWARSNPDQLKNAMLDKLGSLFRCPAMNFDQLTSTFATISLIVPKYVSDRRCFGGDAGALGTNWDSHKSWAKLQGDPNPVLRNLQWKTGRALDCMRSSKQADFFVDVSAAVAQAVAAPPAW